MPYRGITSSVWAAVKPNYLFTLLKLWNRYKNCLMVWIVSKKKIKNQILTKRKKKTSCKIQIRRNQRMTKLNWPSKKWNQKKRNLWQHKNKTKCKIKLSPCSNYKTRMEITGKKMMKTFSTSISLPRARTYFSTHFAQNCSTINLIRSS